MELEQNIKIEISKSETDEEALDEDEEEEEEEDTEFKQIEETLEQLPEELSIRSNQIHREEDRRKRKINTRRR